MSRQVVRIGVARSVSTIAGAVALLSAGAVKAERPTLYPNASRYGERADAARTVEAHGVAVTARVLLSASRRETDLEVTAGSPEGGPAARKILSHELTLLDRGEARVWSHEQPNASSAAGTRVYRNLRRGERIAVRAQVAGVPAPITVRGTVLLRPDLAVETLTAPTRVRRRSPVNVTAVVREQNGDVGASGDCVLSVDGLPVDEARGVWIDGGDAVTCAFTHVFERPGAHTVAVAVRRSAPADDFAGNDEKRASIEVDSATAEMHDATVSSSVRDRLYRAHGAYAGGTEGSGFRYVAGKRTSDEAASLSAWRDRRVDGPLDVTVTETAGARTVPVFTRTGWSLGRATGDDICGTRRGAHFDGAANAWLHLVVSRCGADRSVHAQYGRHAGAVTYYSRGFAEAWLGGHTTPSWSANATRRPDGPPRRPYAADAKLHALTIAISSVTGTIVTEAVIPLAPAERDAGHPLICKEHPAPPYAARFCEELSDVTRGTAGAMAVHPPAAKLALRD